MFRSEVCPVELSLLLADLKLPLMDKLLNEEVLLVAFPHCSNIIGEINPVKMICKMIKGVGGYACVDGVSYAPHGFSDITDLGADIYMFSAYKTYGTHLGVIYISDELNRLLENQGHYFNHGSPNARFTPAGPDHAQIASVNGVIDYFDTIYSYHYDDMSVSDSVKSKKVKSEDNCR